MYYIMKRGLVFLMLLGIFLVFLMIQVSGEEIQSSCLNYPNPDSFCPNGEIVIIGTDDKGCSIYDCLVEGQNQTQEQIQNYSYSGFERFADNVRMFFSFGDKKVMLALEIREKEVNSAMNEFQNGNGEGAVKGLERAVQRLQLVQEKVSPKAAEAVAENIAKLSVKIEETEGLSEDFNLYKLEEEKTLLVSKLIVEVNGTQGQTLKREIVKNETTGKKDVLIVVEGNNGTEGQTKTREIMGDIGVINNQIAERVIKTEIAESGSGGSGGLTPEIKTDVGGNGDDGLKPEVKTDLEEGTIKNEPLPEPDLNAINPDLYDPNEKAPGNTIDDPDGPGGYAEGTTAEGENILAP